MSRIQGPLSGITIVDLTRVLAGPYATMLLSEMGARVIKVEEPGKGDDSRAFGPFIQGRPCYFNSINRNKESIALDLGNADHREILDSMLAGADVIVENFRPGVMEKYGYGWEDVHARFPRLVYASVSGYGHSGPESSKPGYDMVMQGVSGMMSVTGEDGGEPCRTGISIADVGTGLFTATAINAALLHRERTGESTHIDMAMFDCMLSMLETPISRYLMTGQVATRMGSLHPSIMPFEAFPTQDGHITLACGNDKLFRQFCGVIGRDDLADHPDYDTNVKRVENRPALRAEIIKELARDTSDHWVARLSPLGVPIGHINNVEQAVNHPQVAARNMLVTTPDPVLGPLRVVGNPFKMSAFPDSATRKLSPELDEDRQRIIEEFHNLREEHKP